MAANEDTIPIQSDTLKQIKEDFPVLELILRNYLKEEDIALIRKAYFYSYKAHKHQIRANGDPYVLHPIAVAEILAGMQLDSKTISAALLHDIIEDTDYTEDDLLNEFGKEIADLVQGVTKVGEIGTAYRSEQEVENLRRMLVATAKDLRVIIIKLADRLHNLRTLHFLPRSKQIRIAQNTLNIYAPLAHRMGVGRIKWELEDLCFMFLHPDAYQNIKNKVALKRREREQYIQEMRNSFEKHLLDKGMKVHVDGRVKHFYSIYTKMLRTNRTFDEIYDLIALRVICESIGECYAVLGEVHTMWRQVEGRFKDYISNPKPNKYRSIHTTVLGPNGRKIEIQIRTQEMHYIAEQGIAAHWRYKEKSKRKFGEDAKWLQMFTQDLSDIRDPEEYIESIQSELFSDEVYVYTPKGDLHRLPKNACPIDFAYRIHSELGQRCLGAKVNGRLVPLTYSLKTGDVIEIQTSPSARPSRQWLDIVKTSSARNKIRKALLESQRDELLTMGQTTLTRELQRAGFNAREFYKSDDAKKIYENLGLKSLDDLFVSVGFGRISTKQVVARLLQQNKPAVHEKPSKKSSQEETAKRTVVRLADVDDIMYRIARCCNPLPGDDIIGFVTRGRGVSIHKTSCSSLKHFRSDSERVMPLYWEGDKKKPISVSIEVKARDRKNLLSDISQMIAVTGTNILRCNSQTSNMVATFLFTLEVINTNHLDTIRQQLFGINGVTSVRRVRNANSSELPKTTTTTKKTTQPKTPPKTKSHHLHNPKYT
jgi:guanosine-3',5'-bis(diphosphate) 3'-pyrophosphohydrolase